MDAWCAEGLEAVIGDALAALGGFPLVVGVYPPLVRLIGAGPLAVFVDLVPRLGAQDVVHVLDLVVAPDGVVDARPAQRLERVVRVRQGDPAASVQVRQQRLVGKVHVGGVGLHVVEDLAVQDGRGVDDLKAAVHEAEGADGGVGGDGLGAVRVVVLRGEGAVPGHPVPGVVRLGEGVADAGVAGGEDATAGSGVARLAKCTGVVELEIHELVHVDADEHVRVELDDAGVLDEGEGGELAPAVVEARVVGVVLGGGGEEVGDALGGDAAGGEGGEARLGEGVGVEGEERVGGSDGAEGVGEREEAREVVEVGDERGPDCWGAACQLGCDVLSLSLCVCLSLLFFPPSVLRPHAPRMSVVTFVRVDGPRAPLLLLLLLLPLLRHGSSSRFGCSGPKSGRVRR